MEDQTEQKSKRAQEPERRQIGGGAGQITLGQGRNDLGFPTDRKGKLVEVSKQRGDSVCRIFQ